MILAASTEDIREKVFEYARETGAKTILDVGGAEGSWSIGTHVADVIPRYAFTGNLCEPEIWSQIESHAPKWDLIICTHTLEDIRDPGFVLRQMNQLGHACFLAVPNKHSELGKIDSDCYVGFCHHRWIFTLQGEKLRIIAKFPVSARLASANFPGPSFLPWLDPSQSANPGRTGRTELGILWQGELDWEYINNDWAGHSSRGCDGILNMYRDELADGL